MEKENQKFIKLDVKPLSNKKDGPRSSGVERCTRNAKVHSSNLCVGSYFSLFLRLLTENK